VTAAARPACALLLAGSRGADDPVARHAGLKHKALVPAGGQPMIRRVIETLRAAGMERILVCVDPDVLKSADPQTRQSLAGADIRIIPPAASPSASVQRALESSDIAWPLLVTTADHPLLTVAMIEHFCRAVPADADATVGLARATVIKQQQPESIRTFYRFRDDGYSGCNLFLFRGPAVAGLIRFWSKLEAHRKKPWRMVAAVGPLTLIRFALGRLTLADALAHLSSIVGIRIAAADMPFAEAAIDVDKPEDLQLANEILARRPQS
jgi:GTP:adenosylcobinamide-phosphate guanylyltransferase